MNRVLMFGLFSVVFLATGWRWHNLFALAAGIGFAVIAAAAAYQARRR